MDVPAIEGSPTPVLRLVPIDRGLRVSAFVRPFGEDGPHYLPGHAGKSVLALIDGKTQRANRDLEREKAELAALVAACPSLAERALGELEWELPDLFDSLEFLSEVQAYDWPRPAGMAGRGPASRDGDDDVREHVGQAAGGARLVPGQRRVADRREPRDGPARAAGARGPDAGPFHPARRRPLPGDDRAVAPAARPARQLDRGRRQGPPGPPDGRFRRGRGAGGGGQARRRQAVARADREDPGGGPARAEGAVHPSGRASRLSGGRLPLAVPAGALGSRGLPCRRHGPGQDGPGDRGDAGARAARRHHRGRPDLRLSQLGGGDRAFRPALAGPPVRQCRRPG